MHFIHALLCFWRVRCLFEGGLCQLSNQKQTPDSARDILECTVYFKGRFHVSLPKWTQFFIVKSEVIRFSFFRAKIIFRLNFMGRISLLSTSCNYHCTLESVPQWSTTVPELLWVTTETGQTIAMFQVAAECNVKLVSMTCSKIETKQSTGGSSPHASIFVYL